jgi:hypothetical protein
VPSELKASATQEEADSREVARLIAEGKKVTDPELRRRIPPRAECVRQQILVMCIMIAGQERLFGAGRAPRLAKPPLPWVPSFANALPS